jgi:glutathione S-transferase
VILVGQYDSPFVRRVAVALQRYGIAYQQQPWSVWADQDALAAINPLRRVPTLVLENGECLYESYAILDALDEQVGPERALIAPRGPTRRDCLRISALATGVADKAVSLLYERVLRPEPSAVWVERCARQIDDTLTVLEADRAARGGPFWFGANLTHADVAVACALRFAREAHPGRFELAAHSRLAEHIARCEALPEFQAVQQPLSVSL